MPFSDALIAMRQGEKVRLPWWKGYWYISDNAIRIRNADGTDIDLRETKDPIRTVGYMTADCWSLVTNLDPVIRDLAEEMNELRNH